MRLMITTIAIGMALSSAPLANAQAASSKAADIAFSAMDADKNGSISRPEFDAYAAKHAEKQKADFDKQYAELDANKDGKVDKDEAGANAALEAYFDQIDEDSDGFLTKEEIGSAIVAANEASAAVK
jgi:Ca2+-binding EF-hand superfamily protein